jgi:hypothetical protein
MDKKEYAPKKVYCRSILRNKAKQNMKRQGVPMHKAIKKGFFANHWREYA